MRKGGKIEKTGRHAFSENSKIIDRGLNLDECATVHTRSLNQAH